MTKAEIRSAVRRKRAAGNPGGNQQWRRKNNEDR